MKKFLGIVSVVTVLFSLMGPIQTSFANPAVSGVTGQDSDTTGPGLDGRDFRVTWTNVMTPAGYEGTMILIVPSTVTVAVAEASPPWTCNGAPCGGSPAGFLSQWSNESFQAPQYLQNDSTGAPFSAGSPYKACIFTKATVSEVNCSAGFSVTSDSMTDAMKPEIHHMSVFSYISGSTLTVSASLYDDQTTNTQWNNNKATKVFMYYDGVTPGTVTSTAVGNPIPGTDHLWEFETGSTYSRALKYYLKVIDMNNNVRYFTSNPSVDMSASPTNEQAAAAAFTVNPVSAGAYTISGTVRDSSGDPIEGACVWLGGLGVGCVSTDEDGFYEITGVPVGSYDVSATGTGYGEMNIFENVFGNKTVNLTLNSGDYVPMGDGMGGKPHKTFTSPPMGDMYAPVDGDILVGFDQGLDSSTVNDLNAANAGSNVYLTPDNGTTKVAGAVIYCATKSSPGCFSSLWDNDTNVILFQPTANLSPNTFYTLVITGAVKGVSGQAIEGNRPGGGEELNFNTGGEGFDSYEEMGGNYGQGAQYMPPYVESLMPAPGMSVDNNSKISITFNQAMDTSTLTTSNIKVLDSASVEQGITVTTDASRKLAVISKTASNWDAGNYEVRVLGAVASIEGIPMRPPENASQPAFTSNFAMTSSMDSTGPTVYPMLGDGDTGVPVNEIFKFGFNEPLDPTTVTSSNVTLSRGSNSVAIDLKYNTGENNLYIIPNDVLAPNTVYTVSFTASVEDLAGQAMTAQTFSYTTGAVDSVQPKLREARCDDYTCTMFFTEPMNHDANTGDNWATSVLNPDRWSIRRTAPSVSEPFSLTGKPFTYDSNGFSVTIKGIAGLAFGDTFEVTANAAITDLSGANAVVTAGSANVFVGKAENSASTYGDFGGGGMFGPPMGGGGVGGGVGGEYKPEGFGSFTGEQFAFGQVDMAYPFNPMASADVNVFQVRFGPGVALQDNDQIVLTFPSGTGLTNTIPDEYSPFYNNFDEGGAGVTMTFDDAYGEDGVAVDTTANTVTVQVAVTGTPGENDRVVIDLRKIANPAIPKGPNTSGYTVGIQVKRAGAVIANKTSMPYYIMEGGTNSITVNLYAGSQGSPVEGADGDVFLYGGGPSGPMDKRITLTDGVISAVDGSDDINVSYSNLLDGCYFIGTEPFVTLGGADYSGQMMPEPICVNGGQNTSKNIVLGAMTGSNSATLTVKFAGIADFGGADIDVFGSGPGRFAVKNLADVGVPNADGYTLKLSSNGQWFVGVGPGMSKGASSAIPDPLPGVPPPPANLQVLGIGGSPSITTVGYLPPGVTFNDTTDTLTFTFAAADKAITGTVTDGTNPLSNVNVAVHSQGFGAPTFTKTAADGTFTLNVSDYGPYEINVFKDGLPPRFDHIEIQPDGDDEGADPDIYFKGKQITGGNPLVLKLKKPAYYISGKILDGSGNGIAYAPVFADDGEGSFANAGTSSDGSYTLFVDNGTWTVRSNLPPDKTDTCGSFSKTVVVNSANMTNQNISPVAATCINISGTITIGGVVQANVPVFVDEWDTEGDQPASGGFFRPTNTDSNGQYTVKVASYNAFLEDEKTYRIGTWSPDYGEVSTTVAVTNEDETADITTTNGDITFAFTGGTSTMNAFVEVVKSDDTHVRIAKGVNGLDSGLVLSAKEGTYDYRVNVFGIGDFSGTVATGATATIDLSDTTFVTFSGHVEDADGADLKGVLITIQETTTGLTETAVTDANGEYSMNVDAGTYLVSSSLSGYVPGAAPTSETISESTTYDFEAGADQPPLTQAPYVIEGNIYEEGGVTAVSDGYVMATNEDGIVINAPIDPQDGSYSLPVDDGTWTITAVASMEAKTDDPTPVTVSGTDVADNDVTLVADAENVPVTSSQSLAADTGGTFDDTDNTGMKFTAGQGVLETGSGDVSLSMEKTYVAPDTASYVPLGDVLLSVTATSDTTDGQIRDLNGDAIITIDYADLVADLPEGATEADLMCAYYSPERNEYVPVEGGYTVDAANNTVTCQTDHFTDFALVIANNEDAPATPTGLAATAASSSQINLTWTASDGATSYDIYRDTNPAGAFPRVGSEPTVGAVTSYSNTGLSASTTYYYKISALNAEGESAASSAVNATTLAATSTPTGGSPLGIGRSSSSSKTTTTNVKTAPTTPTTTVTVEPTVPVNTLTNVTTETYAVPVDGKVLETVTVSSSAVAGGVSAAAVTLEKGVTVTDAEGNAYMGEIAPPAVATSVSTVAPSGSSVIGSIYEFGVAGKTLTFSEPVKLTIPLPSNVSASEDLSVYYLNETTNEWILAGDGGKVMSDGAGGFVAVVEVTHLTKFAVMKTVGESSLVPFIDLGSHFAKKYIENLYAKGIISGYDTTHFAPDDPVSRAELTKVAVNMFGIETLSAEEIGFNPFKDVAITKWYGPFVHAAMQHGIVSGYSGDLFKPDRSVTRAEALKILFNAAKIDVSGVTYDGKFDDVLSKNWYAPYVAFGVFNGILSGYSDGSFKPDGHLSRGEMAKIAYMLLEKKLALVVQAVFDAIGS